jgi:hypothetical protein
VRFLKKLKKTHNLRIKVCFLLAEKSILFLLVKILKAENKLFIQINSLLMSSLDISREKNSYEKSTDLFWEYIIISMELILKDSFGYLFKSLIGIFGDNFKKIINKKSFFSKNYINLLIIFFKI